MLISDSNVGKKNAVRKNIHYSFKFYIHNMILYIWKKSDWFKVISCVRKYQKVTIMDISNKYEWFVINQRWFNELVYFMFTPLVLISFLYIIVLWN